MEEINLHNIKELCQELIGLGHICDVSKVVGEILTLQPGQNDPETLLQNAEQKLSETQRFADHGKMIFKDTVLSHSKKLENLVTLLTPLFEQWNTQNPTQAIDINYLLFYVKYHDYPEGIISSIGDISSVVKKKLSRQASDTLTQIELRGLQGLGKEGLQTDADYFSRLLRDTQNKESFESQIGSYLDRIDGMSTALHEVRHGNENFVEPLVNYLEIFRDFPHDGIYRKMKELSGIVTPTDTGSSFTPKNVSDIFSIQIDLLSRAEIEDFVRENYLNYAAKNKLETNLDNDFPAFYRVWRDCILFSVGNKDYKSKPGEVMYLDQQH